MTNQPKGFMVYDPTTGQYVQQQLPQMTPVQPAQPVQPTQPVQPAPQPVPTIQVQPEAPVAQPVVQQMPVMVFDPASGQYVQQMMLMQQDPTTGNWIAVQPAQPVAQPAAPAAPGRLLSTGPSYAWLKVGEGCRHKCAFCTIPSIRGPLRSVPAADLREEARGLLAGGVRELVLVAQDLTSWGSDFDTPQSLPHLLDELLPLDRLTWLRLLYLYPSGVTPELLRYMREAGPQLLPYFDIPLQHAHPEVLTRMGRPFANDPRRVVDRVREALPEAALRTTFIVGYPGETEEHFQALCRFVEETRFRHLGVFAYQAEEGTPAAAMPDQVPMEVREERRATLMEIQAEISERQLQEAVGQTMPVLVDAPHDEWPGLHVGRVWFQAPEVDGITYVSGLGVAPGALVQGDIVESSTYDLTALA